MPSKRQAIEDFVFELTRKSDNARPADVDKLCSLARRLHRIDEDDCSIDFSEAEAERRTRREARLVKQAADIAQSIGATIYHQSDPRGWPLYLIFPGDVPDGKDVQGYYNRGTAVPPY